MSDSQQNIWSNNPNAPKIPRALYLEEKATFAGTLIGSILYGIIIVLFFQCMVAMFYPVRPRDGNIKWGLASYTAVMFSVVTVFTATNLNIQSLSFVDHLEFDFADDLGPLGYQLFIRTTILSRIPDIMFLLNGWLADGLLLYRCYIIYSMNLWVIAVPCLMYFCSLVAGVTMFVFLSGGLESEGDSIISRYGRPYLSISVSLNVLLTLMIVTRLALHIRNIRTAIGTPAGIGGSYRTVITMLIESSALYAVSSLLVIAPPLNIRYPADIFLPVLAQTQVIAPLLIIQRVANKSALTGNTVASGHISSFKARTRGELTSDSSAVPGGDPVSSYGMNTGELGVEVETNPSSSG